MKVVISGPSGVGKDAVIKALQASRPDLHFVVTATSRHARHYSKPDVDGHDIGYVTMLCKRGVLKSRKVCDPCSAYMPFVHWLKREAHGMLPVRVGPSGQGKWRAWTTTL